MGGPVTAGVPYIVGEHRPELFVPDTNGRIVPTTSTAAGDTYVFIGNEAIDPHLVRVVRGENAMTARRVKAGRKWSQ